MKPTKAAKHEARKRLMVKRETLRQLTPTDLRRVPGGIEAQEQGEATTSCGVHMASD